MDSKGLRLIDVGGDLEVQYTLGLKREESLKLESISGKPEKYNYMDKDDKEYTTMMINVVDTSSKKPVFRISASKKKESYQESQGQLNAGISSLLQGFPSVN